MNELALFAGGGGGILGGLLLGWRTRCAVEIDAYARRVILARQRDGILHPFPIWDDITTFDGKPSRGHIDIITGGFPCQDISAAGRGAGIDGERSGLWREMARVICEVGPRFVLVENSPMLVHRGLGRVLGDMATMGFNARWGVLGAIDAGAPHRRERIWIVADAKKQHRAIDGQAAPVSGRCSQVMADANCQRLEAERPEQQAAKPCERGEALADASRFRARQRSEWERTGASGEPGDVSDPDRPGLEIGQSQPDDHGSQQPTAERADWWEPEPSVGGMAHGLAPGMDQFATDAAGNLCRVAKGVPERVEKLKALGNGQVPAVVRLAWMTLTEMG